MWILSCYCAMVPGDDEITIAYSNVAAMGPPAGPGRGLQGSGVLAFSDEADILYGGPSVASSSTWTKLISQLSQVMRQSSPL